VPFGQPPFEMPPQDAHSGRRAWGVRADSAEGTLVTRLARGFWGRPTNLSTVPGVPLRVVRKSPLATEFPVNLTHESEYEPDRDCSLLPDGGRRWADGANPPRRTSPCVGIYRWAVKVRLPPTELPGYFPSRASLCDFAEREGFEPSVQFPVHMISNHAPSATRSPLLRPAASLESGAALCRQREEAVGRLFFPACGAASPDGWFSSPSGERGIRTLGTITGTPDFESGTFGHSDISPRRTMSAEGGSVNERAGTFGRLFSPRGRPPGGLRTGLDPEDSRGHAPVSAWARARAA
jgi:hypothetical protein